MTTKTRLLTTAALLLAAVALAACVVGISTWLDKPDQVGFWHFDGAVWQDVDRERLLLDSVIQVYVPARGQPVVLNTHRDGLRCIPVEESQLDGQWQRVAGPRWE